MSEKPLYISYYICHKTSENTLQFYGVCNIFWKGGSEENDTKKSKGDHDKHQRRKGNILQYAGIRIAADEGNRFACGISQNGTEKDKR